MTSPQETMMEVGETGATKIVPDKDAVKTMYLQIKAGMNLVCKEVDMSLDANCYIVSSLVVACLLDYSEIKDDQKYQIWELEKPVEGARNEEELLPLVRKEWKPMISVLKAWAVECNKTNQLKGSLYPFLSAYQISSKTMDALLWQDNTITKSLNIPPWCEIFAKGKNAKDKLNSSRPLAYGPLVHVDGLKKLIDRTSSKKAKLSKDAVKSIKARFERTLNRQLISPIQRKIVKEMLDEDFSHVGLLAMSMKSIKPHIEHQFVLTPPFVFHLPPAKFEGANFTDEWVFKSFATPLDCYFVAPDGWHYMMHSIQIYSIFQCYTEDLSVVEWMFGHMPEVRYAYGKFPNKEARFAGVKYAYDYKYWAKPQKGAPRSIEASRDPQISTIPSFRGKRTSWSHIKTLEQLDDSYTTDEKKTLRESLSEECIKYDELKYEGTGEFYKKGGTTSEPEGKPLVLFYGKVDNSLYKIGTK